MKQLGISLIIFMMGVFQGPCFSLDVDLHQFEKKVYSQNGEDGILEKLFEIIGTTSCYFVEFGTDTGKECNTRFLREKYKWSGLMMDKRNSNPKIHLMKEMITAENINDLFEKYQVPHEFDLLSIDIDFNDFHVWQAIDEKYSPRVVVIEFNATHLPNEDKVVIYDPKGYWDGSNYFGASILAFYNLARKKGYSLVYVEDRGVNLFFVRDDLCERCPVHFKNINNVESLYKKPKYGKGPNGGHPIDKKERQYQTSIELLAE